MPLTSAYYISPCPLCTYMSRSAGGACLALSPPSRAFLRVLAHSWHSGGFGLIRLRKSQRLALATAATTSSGPKPTRRYSLLTIAHAGRVSWLRQRRDRPSEQLTGSAVVAGFHEAPRLRRVVNGTAGSGMFLYQVRDSRWFAPDSSLPVPRHPEWNWRETVLIANVACRCMDSALQPNGEQAVIV